MLTYRGQPLARLEPIRPLGGDIAANDPLYTLAEQGGIVGANEKSVMENAHLTNVDTDRVLYGK